MWTVFYSEIVIAILLFLGVFFICVFTIKQKKLKKQILLTWTAIFVISSVVLGLKGYGIKKYDIQSAATKTYPQEELLEDFDLLQDSIFNQNPFAFTDETELLNLFEQTRGKVKEGMTEEAFYQLINPLVVAVKCGHTNLSVSAALVENRKNNALFFPIELSLQNGAIVAGESNDEFGIKPGDIIESINGNSSEDIISIINKNISHDGDNLAAAQYIASNHFGYEYYEFVEKPDNFLIKLTNAYGEEYSVTVDGEYLEKQNTSAWQLHFEDFKGIEYYSAEIDGKNALLTIKVFFEDEKKFSAFLDEFFVEVQKQGVENLTIDMRGNFGGSPQMSKTLLSYLVAAETPYFSESTKLPLLYKLQGLDKNIIPKENRFTGNTTLIVDAGCFSTCGHFAAVFKSNNLGIVTGEPTAGGAVCTDGSQDIVLKNTGIRLHCSQTIYEVVADRSLRNSVTPD